MLYLDSLFPTPELIFGSAAVHEWKASVSERAGLARSSDQAHPSGCSKSPIGIA